MRTPRERRWEARLNAEIYVKASLRKRHAGVFNSPREALLNDVTEELRMLRYAKKMLEKK
jgi:hypothetical protein